MSESFCCFGKIRRKRKRFIGFMDYFFAGAKVVVSTLLYLEYFVSPLRYLKFSARKNFQVQRKQVDFNLKSYETLHQHMFILPLLHKATQLIQFIQIN
jgi:hypothetical protein